MPCDHTYYLNLHNEEPEAQIRRRIQLFSPQYLAYHPTKPYDEGTQKNCLTETTLLSTHNIGL